MLTHSNETIQKKSSLERMSRIFAKKVKAFYRGTDQFARLEKNEFDFVNWSSQDWSSFIVEWGSKHCNQVTGEPCKYSYTHELLSVALNLTRYVTQRDLKKEKSIEEAMKTLCSRVNEDSIVNPKETADFISEENMMRVLVYLERHPTPENLIASCLITFMCILRFRSGHATMMNIKEKDLCLHDDFIHVSPPASKSEHARVVRRRSQALRANDSEAVDSINAKGRQRVRNLKTNFSLFLKAYKWLSELKVRAGFHGSIEEFRDAKCRRGPDFKRSFLMAGPRSQMHHRLDELVGASVKLTKPWPKRRHDLWWTELQSRAGCDRIVRGGKSLRGFFAKICCETKNESFGWAQRSTLTVYNEAYAVQQITKYMEALLARGRSQCPKTGTLKSLKSLKSLENSENNENNENSKDEDKDEDPFSCLLSSSTGCPDLSNGSNRKRKFAQAFGKAMTQLAEVMMSRDS